jgi:hypothetical protein
MVDNMWLALFFSLLLTMESWWSSPFFKMLLLEKSFSVITEMTSLVTATDSVNASTVKKTGMPYFQKSIFQIV